MKPANSQLSDYMFHIDILYFKMAIWHRTYVE